MDPLGPITISSISQIHGLLGREAPPNPLVSVIAASWQGPHRVAIPVANRRIQSELYAVSLKRGDECQLAFGRQVFDGQAGTIVFLAPGQAVTPLEATDRIAPIGDGWTLVFHPDLICGSALASVIKQYGFFSYAADEALHLADDEQQTLTELVKQIEREAATTPDAYSSDVLAAHLQLLFGYCQRFYARQFRTRARVQGGVLERVQKHLDEYLASARPRDEGLPTVATCAKALGYSPDYLTDLLREETGESTREHIHRAIITAAKTRLASTSDSVSQVAYSLGFEHPQHFAKLFKQKTGSSPSEWRR
ncbi:MAG: helix-turn-helix transcriptional regulator [Myxococcales bacterium]